MLFTILVAAISEVLEDGCDGGMTGVPLAEISPPPWEITAEAGIGMDRTLEVLLVNRAHDLADTLRILQKKKSLMIHLPTKNAESNERVPPPVPPRRQEQNSCKPQSCEIMPLCIRSTCGIWHDDVMAHNGGMWWSQRGPYAVYSSSVARVVLWSPDLSSAGGWGGRLGSFTIPSRLQTSNLIIDHSLLPFISALHVSPPSLKLLLHLLYITPFQFTKIDN